MDFFLKKKNFPKYVRMENPRSEEERLIKDIRNLFGLKK